MNSEIKVTLCCILVSHLGSLHEGVAIITIFANRKKFS